MKHEQSPPASTMNHAPGPDLVKLIECERVHAHLPALLAAAFEGAPQESLVARLEPVARSLIHTLAADALPDQVAKRCTDWLVSELEQFDTKSLLELVELILGGLKATLRSGGGGTTKPHCILPKCLGLLATVDKCCITLKDGSEVHNTYDSRPDGDDSDSEDSEVVDGFYNLMVAKNSQGRSLLFCIGVWLDGDFNAIIAFDEHTLEERFRFAHSDCQDGEDMMRSFSLLGEDKLIVGLVDLFEVYNLEGAMLSLLNLSDLGYPEDG